MQRRTVLGRATGVVAAITFTGCSGGGDATDGNENGTDGGGSSGGDGPSSTGESGFVREVQYFTESVEQYLTVTGVTEVAATDSRLEVDVTLRNDSEESVRMDHYAVSLHVYPTDEPGRLRPADEIQATDSIEYAASEQEPTPPGETVTLGFSTEAADTADGSIQSYKIAVGCGGAYDPPGCG